MLLNVRLARRSFLALIAAAAVLPSPTAAAGLEGRIYDVAAKTDTTKDALLGAAVGARFVLLGEKHDNAEHHLGQAAILNAMIAAGRRPAVVFEMLARSRQPAIDDYLSAGGRDPDRLAEIVAWAASGWPDWSIYRPVMAAALAGGLPIVAGNLDRAETGAIHRGGLAALESSTVERLKLDLPIPERLRAGLLEEVFKGHCELMERDQLAPLVDVQVARDAAMAEAMWRAARTADGAVLIAGAQHARRDLGVAHHLTQRFGAENVLALAFVEARADIEPEHYGVSEKDGGRAFDLLWFTAPGPEKDYCAELRARFGRK